MTTKPLYRCVPLFGPPGVGKGTQGKILAHIPGFFHLSVGDVFRSIDIGSPNGREVYKHISRGELVPDELTIKIWHKAVEAYVSLSWFKPREDLLILDGMPRNVRQVQMIQEHLEIHRVICLKCSDEEDMIHRIRRRAIRENRTEEVRQVSKTDAEGREAISDAISQATGVPEKFNGWPEGYRAIQVWDNRMPSYFFRIFGRPVRATVCECERTSIKHI